MKSVKWRRKAILCNFGRLALGDLSVWIQRVRSPFNPVGTCERTDKDVKNMFDTELVTGLEGMTELSTTPASVFEEIVQ
jgi:hypothetical protein